jgi:hypothetical protein
MPNKPFAATFGFPPQPRMRMRLPVTTKTAPMPAKLMQRAAAKIVATYDPDRVVALRHYLIARGYRFLPVLRNHKKCVIPEWSKLVFNPDDFDAKHASTGIVLDGRIVVIDIDTGYLPHVEVLLEIIGKVAPSGVTRRRGNSARLALIFRILDGENISKVSDLLVKIVDEIDEWGTSKEPKFEVLVGGFLHIDGERAGHQLELIQSDGTPGLPDVDDLPVLTQAQVNSIRAEIAARGLMKTATPATPMAVQSSAVSSQGLSVMAAPRMSSGFSMELFKLGLIVLHKVQAMIGNAGFEAVVAGAIGETRISAPHLEANVVATLKAELPRLPKWNAAQDEKRIDSYASPNPMRENPKRFGSFIAEVDRHAPGWRAGVSYMQSHGQAASGMQAFSVVASNMPALANWAGGDETDDLAANAEWLGNSAILKGALTIIGARGGAGKSTYAMHLALAAASGKPVAGFVIDRTPVAVLMKENTARSVGRSIRVIRTAFGIAKSDIDKTWLSICDSECARSVRLVKGSGRALAVDPQALSEVEAWASVVGLLVLDSLALVANGATNTPEVMAEIVGELNAIAQKTGCAIVLVAHYRKGEVDGDAESAADALSGSAYISNLAKGSIEIAGMSEKQAKAHGVPVDTRRDYIGSRLVKTNERGIEDDFQWYRKRLADAPHGLGTVSAIVLEPVKLAKMAVLADDDAVANVMLQEIAAAEGQGKPLRASGQARPSGADIIATALEPLFPGLDHAARKIIAGKAITDHLRKGLVVKVDFPDAKGNLRPCLKLP